MGKKVYILGGAGNMATPLTLDLGAHLDAADISEMVIGDVDLPKAKKLAAQIGDKRVRAEYIDATAENEAAEKVKGFDLLVNCTFYGFFDNVIRIACKVGVDYTDVGGPEPTEEVITMIKDAGIRADSGVGIVPTVIELLARKGAALMDSTEEMNFYWSSFRNIAPSEGLLATILWENAPVCDERQYYLGGHFIKAGPFEGGKKVKLPDPIGEQMVYYMPHPETVDMAKAMPEVKFISSRGVWRPEVMRDIEGLNRLGLLDDVDLDYKGQKINIYDFTRQCIWRKHGGKLDRRYPWGYMYLVEVTGLKAGKLTTVLYSISHPDWQEQSTPKMVGISGSVNVILLLKKGRNKVGYFLPLEYYDSDDLEYLIKELATRGIVITEEMK